MESWQEVLDRVCERVRQCNSITRFTTLKTCEEKVKFCLRSDVIKPILQQWLNVLCSAKHRKFWEKASELRSEGNIYFNKKHYDKAVELYTRSILSAPFPESPDAAGHSDELSLGFANRSAAFFHSGKYQQALYDIAYALELGYPSHLHFKLFLRRGQCQLRLGDHSDACNSFDTAEECLQRYALEPPKMKQHLKEIENFRKACDAPPCSTKPAHNEPRKDVQTDISRGWHKELPSCTSAVDMLYSTESGRFVVANTDIHPGEALFIEKPYTSVLLPQFAKSHCHHCDRELTNAVPCTQCNQVRYCTFACAKASWTGYHKWECGNLDLLFSIGVAHLALRILLVTGMPNLVTYFQNVRRSDSSEKSHPYHAVFELVSHSEKVHAEDSLQYSITAALLYLLLDRVSFFDMQEVSSRFKEMDIDEEKNPGRNSSLAERTGTSIKTIVGGLLLRHILQLVCNAHAITSIESDAVKEDDVVVTSAQVRVATAIFPSASLMNHSCNPNVISGFINGDTLVVRAVRPIGAGKEVLNCYGPHYRKMPYSERQQALREQYFFTCTCDACRAGDEPDQRLQALKCEYCEGPLRQPDGSGKSECATCGTTQDCLDREQRVFRMHDLYIQGVQLAEKGNHVEALERLRRCLGSREKLMYKHNVKLLEARDAVARCLCSLGDFRSAVTVLRPALEAVREIYGENSIELGHELLKMSDIVVNAIPQAHKEDTSCGEIKELVKEAGSVIDKAEEIFLLHYGRAHKAVQELGDKRTLLSQVVGY
ncbi:SET and MYND domain-containing protein 4-like [Ornithodoros turicata]|uniref:SET and MYND domain-containing protein 4-like n=1 Tax=Ornithodoros turicata TaxID=34597 RepID=UPI0031388051